MANENVIVPFGVSSYYMTSWRARGSRFDPDIARSNMLRRRGDEEERRVGWMEGASCFQAVTRVFPTDARMRWAGGGCCSDGTTRKNGGSAKCRPA